VAREQSALLQVKCSKPDFLLSSTVPKSVLLRSLQMPWVRYAAAALVLLFAGMSFAEPASAAICQDQLRPAKIDIPLEQGAPYSPSRWQHRGAGQHGQRAGSHAKAAQRYMPRQRWHTYVARRRGPAIIKWSHPCRQFQWFADAQSRLIRFVLRYPTCSVVGQNGGSDR